MKWLNNLLGKRYYWYQIDTKTDEIVKTIFSARQARYIRSVIKNSDYIVVPIKKKSPQSKKRKPRL